MLRQAKIDTADLLIAATNRDEINLLCCTTAHGLKPDIHTIARIRNPEYTDQIYEMRDVFALSLVVNPERQTALCTMSGVNSYLAAYSLILICSFLLVSIDGFPVETNVFAVVACFNNVGPGLDVVGPVGSYSEFGILSKLILIIDMLAGRLEIFPILALLSVSLKKSH